MLNKQSVKRVPGQQDLTRKLFYKVEFCANSYDRKTLFVIKMLTFVFLYNKKEFRAELDFIHEDKIAGIGDTDDNKRDFMTLEKKASHL